MNKVQIQYLHLQCKYGISSTRYKYSKVLVVIVVAQEEQLEQ